MLTSRSARKGCSQNTKLAPRFFEMPSTRLPKFLPVAITVGIVHAVGLVWLVQNNAFQMKEDAAAARDHIVVATLGAVVSTPPQVSKAPRTQSSHTVTQPKPKPVEQPRKVAAVEQQALQQREETDANSQDNTNNAQPLQVATPGAAEPQAPTVVMPSSNAAYLNNPKPPYPAISRRLNEQGLVMLRVLINTQGQAEQTELYQSSGYTRLDDSAIKTVSTWRFDPGTTNGVPQAMWFNVPVNFVLE